MLTSNRETEMIGQKVLILQSVKVMKGDKVLSEKIIFERAKEVAPLPPPPAAEVSIQKPKSPPISPTVARPEFLEPLGLSPTASDDFKKMWREDMKDNEKNYNTWEANQASTWEREIERLEKERERYNTKSHWSAPDLANVERIDKDLMCCIQILDRFYEYGDDAYDSE